MFRASLLYVWVTRGPFGRRTKSLCDFGGTTPHTLVGGAQTTLTARGRASVRADRRTSKRPKAQGRPWDLEGTPSPGPQGLWADARGSQGPSGRPATRGTIPDHRFYDHDREGVNCGHLSIKENRRERRGDFRAFPSLSQSFLAGSRHVSD